MVGIFLPKGAGFELCGLVYLILAFGINFPFTPISLPVLTSFFLFIAALFSFYHYLSACMFLSLLLSQLVVSLSTGAVL